MHGFSKMVDKREMNRSIPLLLFLFSTVALAEGKLSGERLSMNKPDGWTESYAVNICGASPKGDASSGACPKSIFLLKPTEATNDYSDITAYSPIPLPSDFTLDMVVASQKKSLKNSPGSEILVQPTFFTVSGYQAVKMQIYATYVKDGTNDDDPVDIFQYIFFIKKDSLLYKIDGHSRADEIDAYLPIFEKAFKTIEIK